MPKSHPLMLMSTKLWERWLKPNCVSWELTPPPKCCCTWSSYCCCFSFSNIFPHTGQSSTWVRFAIQHMGWIREHLRQVLLHVALKVSAPSREGSVAPRAVHFLHLNLCCLFLLGLPCSLRHAVRSWLPRLQLWDWSRGNLWQERRWEGGCGAGWLGEGLEQGWSGERGAGESCANLGAVHVPLGR